MRKLLFLALLLPLPAFAANPLPIYCIAATLANCNSLTQVGNGTQGDIWWKAFGKVNDIGNALSLFGTWPPANGTLLIGNGTNYVPGTITAGTNVTVTNGPGTITISSTGGGTPGGSNFELQYNSSGTFSGIALGTAGYPLISDGSAGAPAFGALNLSLSGAVSGTLPSANIAAALSSQTSINGTSVPASDGTLLGTGSLGTGVNTALGIAVGSSGAFVTNGGALGTPSSGVATNLTGTASGLSIGGNAATATDLSTTGANGTFWGVSGGVQGYYTPTAAASSVTPGTTTVVGATAPCLLDNSTSTTMGCAALGQGLSLSSGTLGTTAPQRTVTASTTVASTDMGGVLIMNVSGGGTLTIPAIGSGVFGAAQSLWVVNYSASAVTVSTTPTINSGGGCVTATGIPAGDAWQLISNGTTLDCAQTVSSSSGGSPAFNTIASGTNTTATMLVGTGATFGILGSSTGYVQLASQASGATNYTATLPANNGTIAELGISQTWTTLQTFHAIALLPNTATSATSVTPNCGYSFVKVVASATGTFTVNAPSCTPTDGQKLELKVTSPSGGTITYSWNAAYLASATVALPTTSNAASKEDYFEFQYDSDKSGWVMLAYNQGF